MFSHFTIPINTHSIRAFGITNTWKILGHPSQMSYLCDIYCNFRDLSVRHIIARVVWYDRFVWYNCNEQNSQNIFKIWDRWEFVVEPWNLWVTHYRKVLTFTMQLFYSNLHGYLALVVCLLGSTFNIVNSLVLSHRDMKDNPTNMLLTGKVISSWLEITCRIKCIKVKFGFISHFESFCDFLLGF